MVRVLIKVLVDVGVSRAFPLKLAHPKVTRFGNSARSWWPVIGEFCMSRFDGRNRERL